MKISSLYTIFEKDTILSSLKKINENKKGFLIVIDDNQKVLGTLTDGDIRRAFISNKQINDKIACCYNKDFIYIDIDSCINIAIDIFKNNSVSFLPIIDSEKRLVNVLTKTQLHTILLQDIHTNLYYDFESLDDTVIDHEVFQRPWGFYKTTLMNKYCQSKIICVYPNSQLSLQSHDFREEHWIVAHGHGIVQICDSKLDAKCGSVFFIPKGAMHRLTNTSNTEYLILTELQIGEYFGEDDIHRFEDKYGRV